MTDYTINHSQVHMPFSRTIVDVHGMDAYRIEVAPHLEYLRDTPEARAHAALDVSVFHPAHHDKRMLSMLESEACAVLVGLAKALHEAGVIDPETRGQLRAIIGVAS